MMEIGLNHYLVLATILFGIGLYGVMRRKNLLRTGETGRALSPSDIREAAIPPGRLDSSRTLHPFCRTGRVSPEPAPLCAL